MTVGLQCRRGVGDRTRVELPDLDLYGRAELASPHRTFTRIRDAGPVVWLPRNKIWAMGRFDDVRSALRDPDAFRSGPGVAANPVANALGHHTTLASDGDVHMTRRMILMQSLTSRAIQPSLPTFEREAVDTVERVLGQEYVDGIADVAARLPVAAVSELVGVRVTPSVMLRWAGATFDALGPANSRTVRSLRHSVGMYLYTQRLRRSSVTPGGWAATIFDAADRGEISMLEAKNMIIDFVAPSLDTTILATGQLLWSLGRRPDMWQRLRAEPDLIPTAVIEAVRLASPVRGFTRHVATETMVGDTILRRGDRVAVLFAAANSDERHFYEPDQFTLDRRGGNLGWGHGIHTCVGMQLAKLEMATLLRAMIPRVESISVSEPERLMNNCLQGFTSFRAEFR
jgi:cytochrome P450